MTFRNRALVLGLSAAILAAGCTSGSSASPSAGASSSPPPPVASAAVETPEQAAELVLAQRPEFAGLQSYNPELIGACCWYEVTPVADGYTVNVTIGWGDCPAGCIERHTWTYAVAADGRVGLLNEEGPSLPASPGVD